MTEQGAARPRFHLGYRPELDGLRGIAIISVMLYHLKVHVAGHRVPSGGYFGVDVFFVLSGFLITALLVEEWERHGTIRLGHFYLRRVLRLFPALALMLAAVTAYAVALDPNRGERRDILHAVVATLTYSANWVDALRLLPHGLGALGIAWSLAIEEQFYLVWPLALLLVVRASRRTWPVLALALTAAGGVTAVRAWRYLGGAPWWRIYFGSDTRADSLLVGCALGVVAAGGLVPTAGWGRRAIQVAAALATPALAWLLLATPKMDDLRELHLVAYSGAAASAAAIIALLLAGPPALVRRALGCRPLVWVGRLSYGLYLWHEPIFVFFHPRAVPAAALPYAQVTATVGVVLASYYLVERPCLRLKSRLGRRAPAPREIPAHRPLGERSAA